MALPNPGTPIILDIGSAYVKLGFAGEPGPRFVFPSITGYEKYKSIMVDVNARNVYVGNDAMKMRGVLKVKYPIQRGIIMDWNEYYEILNHALYNLLRLESLSDYPIIYSEHPFVPKETKEYIARVLFETHRVKSLIMLPSPFLSIFSVGLMTGLVVESGDGITWIVPIINGQIMYQAVQRLECAGYDVNHNLKTQLMREGINIQSSSSEEIFKQIKEKNCYFVLDPKNPPSSKESYSYPMPDGTIKEIPNSVLYGAPEVMFQPSMLGYNIMNIPQAIIYCLKSVESEYWAELLSHIVLSGGNLSYSGFEDRLKIELNLLLSQLGKIPKSEKQVPFFKIQENKLKNIESVKKKQDNCPACGSLVDLSNNVKNCPSCGASMKSPQISLEIGTNKKEIKSGGKCPYCNKDIKDKGSVFCPYCGKNVTQLPTQKITEEIIEKVPIAEEFAESNETDDIIKFFVPDNLQFAIFNGASILGSLPSFQSLFITQEEFQNNANVLYRDISDVFR